MKLTHYFIGLVAWGLLGSISVQANANLDRAISHCALGLQAPAANTPISFKVLQRYLQKYQAYRRVALLEDAKLKRSKQVYTGAFFKGKSYAAIQKQCNQALNDKVAAAIVDVRTQQAQAARKQQYLSEYQQKQQNLAKQQADLALGSCQVYVKNKPSAGIEAQQLYDDFDLYHQAAQQAVQMDQAILNMTASAMAKGKQQTLSFGDWFEYCANVFAGHQAALEQRVQAAHQAKLSAAAAAKKQVETQAAAVKTAQIAAKPEATIKAEQEAAKQAEAVKLAAAKVEEQAETVANPVVEPVTKPASTPKNTENKLKKRSGLASLLGHKHHKKAKSEKDDAAAANNETDIAEDEALNDEAINDDELADTAEDELVNEDNEDAADMDEDIDEDAASNEDDLEDDEADFDPFEALLASAQGDRLNVLNEEMLEPSFMSEDSDDVLQAKTWYYDEVNACRIYQFKQDKLLNKKTLKTVCPDV